jgi:hypothetical protein
VLHSNLVSIIFHDFLPIQPAKLEKQYFLITLLPSEVGLSSSQEAPLEVVRNTLRRSGQLVDLGGLNGMLLFSASLLVVYPAKEDG